MKNTVIVRKRTIELPEDLHIVLSCFCDESLMIPLNATHLRTQLLEAETPWTLYRYCGSVKDWYSLFKDFVASAGTAVLKLTTGETCLVSDYDYVREAIINYFPDVCDVYYCMDLASSKSSRIDMDLLLSNCKPRPEDKNHMEGII